jgi:hypothetical protein
MRFKTTIKIITEARDKNEAMDIAGDYLSGNLTTGVDMRLRATPMLNNKQRTALALSTVILIGCMVIQLSFMKQPQGFVRDIPGNSVIQPPLKTSPAEKGSDFKKEWQSKHAQEVFNSLKK